MNRKIDLEQERIFENENVLGSNQRKKQEKNFLGSCSQTS